jgi:hypothetical protein
MRGERSTPVNWRVVQREHVLQACELITSGRLARPARGRGLFVVVAGSRLPAKDVARAAYLLAVGKPADAYFDFASGQTTLDMFKRLGFEVERSSSQSERRG